LVKASGMSFNYNRDTEVVDFVFTPGMGYETGDIVNSYIRISNSQFQKLIKFRFEIIGEGLLLIKQKSTGALLSPLINKRYLLYMSASTDSVGDLKIIDTWSDVPVVLSKNLSDCSRILSAGIYNGEMLFYSCVETDETKVKITYAEIFDNEGSPVFTPAGAIKEIIIPKYSQNFTQSEADWLGMRDDYLFIPDYTSTEKIKIFGKGNGFSIQKFFKTIEDVNWVAAPSSSYAPEFNISGYGVSLIKDKEGRFLISASKISNWPKDYNGISEHLAMIKTEKANNFTNARIDYLLPVTLPENFSDTETIFHPVFWGDLTDGRSRFILVDGNGEKGAVGYLADEGVDFSNDIVTFPFNVSKVFVEDSDCFFVSSDNGKIIQRYCNINGNISETGREVDIGNFISEDGELSDMRFEEGRVIMVYKIIENGEKFSKVIMVNRELLR
jgi:hypothetical protein